MYKWNKVIVAFSTYNEKASIKDFINACFDTWVVDEVVAVNNNAAPWTSEEIAKTIAIEFHETKQWYGFGYRRAIDESLNLSWDIIILVEPDGTFKATDIFKLLIYWEEFSVVFGTRTTSSCIGSGANMGFFLKWWNWAVAKLMEVFYNTTHLSDVWCTYKLFHKQALQKIKNKFTVWWSHFGPELMLLTIQNKLSFVEIPINYLARVWDSSVTWDLRKTIKLGTHMIFFILLFKFRKHD